MADYHSILAGAVRGLDPSRQPYVGRGLQFGGTHRGGVMVAFADGSSLQEVRLLPSGTRQFPMSEAQIRDKFFDCAALAVDRNAAEKILATLSGLGDRSSLREFWPLLRRP